MLVFLPSWLRGGLAYLLIIVCTLALAASLHLFALVKYLLPQAGWRRFFTRTLTAHAEAWNACNGLIVKVFLAMSLEFRCSEPLVRNAWYLVLSNHQTWWDAIVLYQVLCGRIPLPKGFMKKELLYLPLFGTAAALLDFPVMHRYNRSVLTAHPELAGRDLEETRRACRHFVEVPTTVFNFVEGTRKTAENYRRQQPPYHHLLKPKAGGIAFVFESMGTLLDTVLDLTIVYPDGEPSFWGFLSGRCRRVVVDLRRLETPSWIGTRSYRDDLDYRRDFQHWLRAHWAEKDRRIEAMLAETRHGVAPYDTDH
ncbi:MAG: hypothetical protein A2284_11320 [Deltaproteobacteria bacterium RIFOXYA12_FULL_61_11]|nr:MAG: hypothetical protein A2284_11320 [Deltaproteobacteria bacterium RIFOXYA12_FULL_61_11]